MPVKLFCRSVNTDQLIAYETDAESADSDFALVIENTSRGVKASVVLCAEDAAVLHGELEMYLKSLNQD